MVSKKLQNIFLIVLGVIYVHGIEEILTGFSSKDSFMIIGSEYLNTNPEQFYWISHIMWWFSLPILYFLFHKTKVALLLFSLFGIFFIIELHHLVKAFQIKNYYPGSLTALVYPFIGIFYWKELVINWRKKYGRS